MRRLPEFGCTLLVVMSAAAPLAGQIPQNKQRGVTPTGSSLPHLMVANPYPFASQDSAQAVQLGAALRLRMEKVAGNSFQVITRQQMNDALGQFGYPVDAILPLPVQRNFATSLQARTLLASTLSRGEGGRYTITARLAGLNDDAGNAVTMTQSPGQKLEDFGNLVADAFGPAVKTSADVKACFDQRLNATEKALSAAKKAVQAMPKNGAAHYCFAMLALDRKTKADSQEAMKHLQEAVAGDPFSLPAWTAIAAQYEAAGDTTKTVEALKQMLLIAPTNQPLREQAFKLFIKYEHPEAAEKAALDGLKLEPTNADLWDLLSNARVYKGDFKGAVDALEQVVANDSTKADSTFLMKITVMASQQPDTVRLLKWAHAGARRYPTHLGLLQALLSAYTMAGPVDSAAAVAKRLIAVDTTAVGPALAVAQQLIQAKRLNDALPLLQFAVAHGDAQARENASALLLNGALPMIQGDPEGAATHLRSVIKTANPTGRFAPIANYYLGLIILQQIQKVDPEAEKQKSCDLANKEQAMLAEADAAVKGGTSYKPEDSAKFQKYVDGLKPRVASMLKAYCK